MQFFDNRMILNNIIYMMDELMQLETDAFNTHNGEMPSENDLSYKKYEKYGWLWDMFCNADIREE